MSLGTMSFRQVSVSITTQTSIRKYANPTPAAEISPLIFRTICGYCSCFCGK